MDLQIRRISGNPADFVGGILAPGCDYEAHVSSLSDEPCHPFEYCGRQIPDAIRLACDPRTGPPTQDTQTERTLFNRALCLLRIFVRRCGSASPRNASD